MTSSAPPSRPQQLAQQVAIQGTAFLLALGLTKVVQAHFTHTQANIFFVLSLGSCAALIATLTKQRWWWSGIHATLPLMAYVFFELSIPPVLFLCLFLLSFVIYRGAAVDQIPLYLSNNITAQVVNELLTKHGGLNCVEIGAGIGTVASVLAKPPSRKITCIENAVLTWLIGKILTRYRPNIVWKRASFWHFNYEHQDFAYAFLSPAPMRQLWEKLQAEMPEGSLFISNSFPCPDIAPTEVVEVNDHRHTRLYCYIIKKP